MDVEREERGVRGKDWEGEKDGKEERSREVKGRIYKKKRKKVKKGRSRGLRRRKGGG